MGFALQSAVAQNPVVPVLKRIIPVIEVHPDGGVQQIDLTEYLGTEEVRDQAVRLTAEWVDVSGAPGTTHFDFLLFRNTSVGTVSNFLGYVNRDDYVDSIVHRLMPGFVIQGGGFKMANNGDGVGVVTRVPTQTPIVNEFEVSNTFGTISMAKLGGNPDGATSQWFISTAENSTILDPQNGGFTVFGKVSRETMVNAMSLDGLGQFRVENLSLDKGEGALTNVPIVQGVDRLETAAESFFRFTSIAEVPLPSGQAGTSTTLNYSLGAITGGGGLSVTQTGNFLNIDPSAADLGEEVSFTIEAEDSVGNTVEASVLVKSGQGYEDWRSENFSGSDLTDDSVSGPGADPNGDGVVNFNLFVYGLSAGVDASQLVPTPEFSVSTPGAAFEIRLSQEVSPYLLGVTHTLEFSTDLVTWNPVQVAATVENRGESDLVTFPPVSAPRASFPTAYFRMVTTSE